MHLDSADDVVMVAGPVEVVRDAVAIARAAEAFRAKYVDGETGAPFDVYPALDVRSHQVAARRNTRTRSAGRQMYDPPHG